MVVTDISLLRATYNVDHDSSNVVELGQLYDAITESTKSSSMFAQSIIPQVTSISDAEYSYVKSEIDTAEIFGISNKHRMRLLSNKLNIYGGSVSVKHKNTYKSETGRVSQTARYVKILRCDSLPHDLLVNKNLPRSGFTHVISHVYFGIVIELRYEYTSSSHENNINISLGGGAESSVHALDLFTSATGEIENIFKRNGIVYEIKTNVDLADMLVPNDSIKDMMEKIGRNIGNANVIVPKCVRYTVTPVGEINHAVHVSDIDEELMSYRIGYQSRQISLLCDKMDEIGRTIVDYSPRDIGKHAEILGTSCERFRNETRHLIGEIRSQSSNNLEGIKVRIDKFWQDKSEEYNVLVKSLDFFLECYIRPLYAHNANAHRHGRNYHRPLFELLLERIARSDIVCTHTPDVTYDEKKDLVDKKWWAMIFGEARIGYYFQLYNEHELRHIYAVFYEASYAYRDRNAESMEGVLVKYANGKQRIQWNEGSIISKSSSDGMLRNMRMAFNFYNLRKW